jgi:hypothetical protein
LREAKPANDQLHRIESQLKCCSFAHNLIMSI